MLHGIGKQLTKLLVRSRKVLLPWGEHPMMVLREFLAPSCEAAGLGHWQGWALRVAEQWADPPPSHSLVPIWARPGITFKTERGKPKGLQGVYLNTPDINPCLLRTRGPSELIGTKEKKSCCWDCLHNLN